jgi:hypothetical protein
MRIETKQEEALIIGADTTSFGLNLKDPSVFVQMLLNLYKSPIDSVVRECASNAIDANVESGTDQPVVIGIENNNFFVRDFGLGLSPEFMNNGYCTIGYSTKRDSDILIGGYGMGRVSPLAYTNQYWINTVHQGISYEYLIFLDGNTIKQTLLKQEITDQPSGTTVTVKLKNNYYEKQNWTNAIKQQCAYFDKAILSLDETQTVEVTCNQYTRESNIYTGKTHIVFGCVYYPIDWDLFRAWNFLADLDLGIYIGINEGLVPNPGRESYILNDAAKTLLISKFESVCETIWKECDTYLRELNEKKEIHRLKFRGHPRIVSQQINYVDYKTICALLNKDVVNVEVYPEIESNPHIVWRDIVQGFNGMRFDIKPIYKQSWTKLNKEFCKEAASRSKSKIEFYYSVVPDYTDVEPNEKSNVRQKRHDEIRDELVKQFIEEFTIPFDEEGFNAWKKSKKKDKRETRQGVSYYRKSLNGLTNCVKDKGEVNLNQYHYIFTVDSDETAKKFWYSVSKLKKSIILYKDKSGMSTSLDELKPTPFLKRLCSEALRAKVGNILGSKITDKTVLKIIQELNPLLHQYLVELDLNVGRFTDEHKALVEAGELLSCFDKDEMKLKYVGHHLNKLLFIKYLGRKRYDWEETQYDADEIKLIKRYYILERLAEKKEVKEEVDTNQLTLELC